MKRFFSIILCILSISAICAFTACGSGTVAKNEKTLNIRVFEGGYGTDWINALKDEFVKENPDITVKVYPSTLRNQIQGDINVTKAEDQKYDLYFSDYSDAMTHPDKYVELTDVYNYKSPGDDKTIGEKMNPFIMDNYSHDGKYYYMNWGTTYYGIVYNTEILKDYGIPRTTDELLELCAKLKQKGIDSFIFGSDTNYWDEIYHDWWAQYSGREKYNLYWEGRVEKDGIYTSEIFEDRGRLEALKVIEEIITYDNGYIDLNSSGYGYMVAQKKFLEGSCAMMVNGGWLENEMSDIFPNGSPVSLDFMDLPVISSIADNLSTVNDDETLRQVIDYIDGKAVQLPSGVSEEDAETVRVARNVQMLSGVIDIATIPATAYNKDLAKTFLKFMYSDKGIDIYTANSAGAQLPLANDYIYSADTISGFTTLQTTAITKLREKDWIVISLNTPLTRAGLTTRQYPTTLELSFGVENSKDRKTALEIFEYDISYYSNNNGSAWKNLLKSAGLM